MTFISMWYREYDINTLPNMTKQIGARTKKCSFDAFVSFVWQTVAMRLIKSLSKHLSLSIISLYSQCYRNWFHAIVSVFLERDLFHMHTFSPFLRSLYWTSITLSLFNQMSNDMSSIIACSNALVGNDGRMSELEIQNRSVWWKPNLERFRVLSPSLTKARDGWKPGSNGIPTMILIQTFITQLTSLWLGDTI